MYKQATSDENYNYEINKNMELEYDFYFLGIYRKGADLIKKAKTKGKDILFSISIQNHVFEQKLGDGWTDEYGLRDVTNEEVSLQSYLGLIYGAKQIMDYSYNSDAAKVKADGTYYDYGLVKDENGTRRLTNYYGQPKWQYLCNLNAKLRQIGDYMYPAGESTKHLILDDSRTINTIFETYHPEYDYGLPYKYISDIISNYYVNGVIHSDNTDTRYWEVGTFKQPDGNTADKYSKYFIMLNKRCTPPLANVTAGDVRTLKMKFKPDELSGFNNWVVIDPLTNITIATIDKNSGEYYSLGIFQPGEGRLFKLAPVMQEGGTFVCDENVLNTSFVCKAIVYSGGYKLSLISNNSSPMTVSFKTSGMIHGDNGSEVQIYGTQNNKINLQGFGNEKGSGIDCEEINYLNISNANITGISAGWAITAYDCDGVSIENCNINLTENGMRAININSTSNSNTYSNILNNIISVKNCSTPVYVISSANASDDLFFAGNVITSSEQSQIGAFLSNVTSIYIYNNSIGGFETGIKLLGCTLDLTNNAITGLGTDFTGIYCTAESTINMGLVGDYYRGGINSFINTLGNNCVNIKLDNSVFNMDYGNNDLQVGLNTGSYNMYGTGNFATEDGPVRYIEAKGNCFNGDGNNAIHYLTDPDNYVFSLHELPHNCNIQQDMIAEFTVPITENITDTIYKTTNPQYQNLSNSKLLYRNFYKNILLKNYDSALIIGTNLLSNFADSVNSTDVISKLYFAVSKLDTGGQRTAALKTFYEQLILNNSQNSLLVMSANYFSQKCKVRLHQYTSALDGFQDIMAQNPYSYEGVVASWDYAATLLLANSSGGFAGDEENMQEISNIESNSEFLVDSIRINRLLKMDNYDKKIFTQENRKQLHKSVGDILKEGRNKQVEKVKTLEEKHTKADDKEKVKIQKEIEGSKLINSVVKVKKPKDNAEYQAIINSDIEKLHPKKNSAVTGKENCIPKTFELYQNYPNPFNPTTKIAFDLPKDAKVKLIIYDILGREVKTLVNNEFRAAGKYISEFNGSQLASGVYFARILINDGKEFVSVKKMVLIK
jgi:hypothetical protein